MIFRNGKRHRPLECTIFYTEGFFWTRSGPPTNVLTAWRYETRGRTPLCRQWTALSTVDLWHTTGIVTVNSFDEQVYNEYEGCEAKDEYLIPSWENDIFFETKPIFFKINKQMESTLYLPS